MSRCTRITVFLVVLSLTGWAQNPFEQQAAADYTGVFVSKMFKLRLYGDADKIVGELRWSEGDKRFDVSGSVNEGVLRGTFSNGSGNFPFSLKQSGEDYAFVAGSEKATLMKFPPLDLSGEWGNSDASLTVKLGDVEGNQIQGIVFFKGQKYVLSGTTSGAGVIGSFSANGQAFPMRLLQDYMENRLQFTTGSYSTLLRCWREMNRRRQELAEELDDPDLPELHAAAGRGDVARIRELLAAGAKVDARAKGEMQPIHYAARFGRVDAVRALVAAGADVAALNDGNVQSIHHAASLGAVGTIEYLVSQGAAVNAKAEDGLQPIHIAARLEGDADAIKCLVSLGADVNAKNKEGLQPIHIAAWSGSIDAIGCLVSLGADINAKADSDLQPIHIAAGYGHVSAIRCLVKLGADVNAKTSIGKTPLDAAEGLGTTEAAAVLRELGGKPGEE